MVADEDEVRALQAAVLIVHGEGRQRRMLLQVERRHVFREDLGKAILALGGVPTTSGSFGARLGGAGRWLKQVLTGGHEGDAYASCAKATENTGGVYARALRTPLPDDVRFGVEQELAEIEWDRRELTRLRFGAPPSRAPVELPRADGSAPLEARASLERSDERALQTWNDEGGAGIQPSAARNAESAL
jgi:hypothetical protein